MRMYAYIYISCNVCDPGFHALGIHQTEAKNDECVMMGNDECAKHEIKGYILYHVIYIYIYIYICVCVCVCV